jgi:hypothetical protein
MRRGRHAAGDSCDAHASEKQSRARRKVVSVIVGISADCDYMLEKVTSGSCWKSRDGAGSFAPID